MEQVVQLRADLKAQLVAAATQAARTLKLLFERRTAYQRKPSAARQNAIHMTACGYLCHLKALAATVSSSSEDLRQQGAGLRTTLSLLREIVAGALCLTDLPERVRGAVLAEISSTLVLEEYTFGTMDVESLSSR
jgi:hypothetical protein